MNEKAGLGSKDTPWSRELGKAGNLRINYGSEALEITRAFSRGGLALP